MDLQMLAEALEAQRGNPVCAAALERFEAECRRLVEAFKGLKKDWGKATFSALLPDGRLFIGDNAAEVFAETIRAIGPARVAGLGIACEKEPLVARKCTGKVNWKKLGEGWFLCTHSSTRRKVELLRQIGVRLALVGMKVFGVEMNAQRSSSGFVIVRERDLVSSSVRAINI